MSEFPENILDLISRRILFYFEDEYTVVRRPVRVMDPALTIGLFSEMWAPVADSYEIGSFEPVLGRYNIRVQLMVKAADEVEGRRKYTVDSKALKVILYRDPTIRLELTQLQEELLDTVERLKRFGIVGQRYLNNEVAGEMVYLSTTTCWIETEFTSV